MEFLISDIMIIFRTTVFQILEQFGFRSPPLKRWEALLKSIQSIFTQKTTE